MSVAPKRIIACCDGTWVNGISEENRSGYTNVLRISRALEHHDVRAGGDSPIAQVVYYGSGIGSDPGLASYDEGLTGAGLATKVEEAYAFISQNYVLGDEVFLIGFSRGAYTARMVAGIIGEIGILNKIEMEQFPDLFIALQTEGDAKKSEVEEKDKVAAQALVEPFKKKAQLQIQQAGGWLIKAVGVFDTVGSVGLPAEIHKTHPRTASLFGFSNTGLGTHIQLALHALALNETRKDFSPTKWTQTEAGRAKGQELKQVWFSGSHSDIGGGWDQHDLADITLAWMVAETSHLLAYDPEYLQKIPNPVAPYGQQPPHNPQVGMFKFTDSYIRPPPTEHNPITRETIHLSVTKQISVTPLIEASLRASPSLVRPLVGFEATFEETWKYDPTKKVGRQPQTFTAKTREADQTTLGEAKESQPANALEQAVKTAEGIAERLSGIKIHGHSLMK